MDWTLGMATRKVGQVADSLNVADRLKKQIFKVNVLGFQTHRDDFAIAFEKHEIESRIRDMR